MQKEQIRDKQYKVLSMRLHDDVIKELKELQRSSGKSWNLFIKELINK